MAAEDLQLNCGIRSVLSRHWIDLSKTSFYARRGHIHLSGEVSVIGPARGPEDTARTLKFTESELRRLRDVKTISFDFTNWVRDDGGTWICLDDPAPDPMESPAPGEGPGGSDLSAGGGRT